MEKCTVTFTSEDGSRKATVFVSPEERDGGLAIELQVAFDPMVDGDDDSLYVGLALNFVKSFTEDADDVEVEGKP
jgi:hypothetical protein